MKTGQFDYCEIWAHEGQLIQWESCTEVVPDSQFIMPLNQVGPRKFCRVGA